MLANKGRQNVNHYIRHLCSLHIGLGIVVMGPEEMPPSQYALQGRVQALQASYGDTKYLLYYVSQLGIRPCCPYSDVISHIYINEGQDSAVFFPKNSNICVLAEIPYGTHAGGSVQRWPVVTSPGRDKSSAVPCDEL